ncbi:MAG: carbon-nitrogen hydrolase family protein [Candidatus Promineifilaceae bacterium]
MKIAAAQTRPVKGDIRANIETHRKIIEKAVSRGADVVVFPELSLTGYEPRLAEALATTQDDARFEVFQALSDADDVIVGVGVPLKSDPRPTISMVIFQPGRPRQVYSKGYIHADEGPFFVNGRNAMNTLPGHPNIALAICYEISVPEHAEDAFHNGAEIYFASVAKFMSGIDESLRRLSEIARRYSMTVIMVNCVGVCDGEVCAGMSAVWNDKGELLGQLGGKDEGIILYDSISQEVVVPL